MEHNSKNVESRLAMVERMVWANIAMDERESAAERYARKFGTIDGEPPQASEDEIKAVFLAFGV